MRRASTMIMTMCRRMKNMAAMLMRIMNMTRESKRRRVLGVDAAAAHSDHLAPVGRGRPSAARSGEGGPNHPSSSVPPLPTSKSDISDFDQSSNARTREHPGSGGERENVTARSEHEAAAVALSALYRLMAWLSPAYPVGAFSYSIGLALAVEARAVTDARALAAWLTVIIGEGSGFCDAVLFAHAHRASAARAEGAVRSVAELAAAFAPS